MVIPMETLLILVPNVISCILCAVVFVLTMSITGTSIWKKFLRLTNLLILAFVFGNAVSWKTISYRLVDPAIGWCLLLTAMLIWSFWALHRTTAKLQQVKREILPG